MPCTLSICNQCFKKIESYGSCCVDICVAVCDTHIENKSAICNPIHIEESVEFLEKNGFIQTTEVSKTEICIKPANFKIYEYENAVCFCWCVDE